MVINLDFIRNIISINSLRFLGLASLLMKVVVIDFPVYAQPTSMFICGAETGKVYLRSKPTSASQNSKRTLNNGTPVQTYDYSNGFTLVKTNNGMTGWVTERYVCQNSFSNSQSSYICRAETGKVYLRSKPTSASQNSKQTLSNGTPVQTYDYNNGFILVKKNNGMTGWVTERYVCP